MKVLDELKKEYNKKFDYNKKYDFEDIKILTITQNYFKSWKINCGIEYEDYLCIVNVIKRQWKKQFDSLTEINQTYISQYCYDFLENNKKEIKNSLIFIDKLPF